MNTGDIKMPSNRSFGFFFSFVFILIALFFIYEMSFLKALIFTVLSLFFLLTAFLKSEILSPLNYLWMRFGIILGIIIQPIVLGFIFFIIFTPISFLMKIFRRDELRLKLENRASHWKIRNEDFHESDTFNNQF